MQHIILGFRHMEKTALFGFANVAKNTPNALRTLGQASRALMAPKPSAGVASMFKNTGTWRKAQSSARSLMSSFGQMPKTPSMSFAAGFGG